MGQPSLLRCGPVHSEVRQGAQLAKVLLQAASELVPVEEVLLDLPILFVAVRLGLAALLADVADAGREEVPEEAELVVADITDSVQILVALKGIDQEAVPRTLTRTALRGSTLIVVKAPGATGPAKAGANPSAVTRRHELEL